MKKTNAIALLLMTASMFLIGEEASTKKKTLKFSFSERLRLTSFDNSINLNDEAADTFDFTRHLTSVGLLWTPRSDLEIKAALSNEFRSWLSPKNRSNTFTEIFFDQLYVKWKGIGHSGLTLTLGRQNIMLGEGFVCLDAQPQTGSRSAYFNAFRADYSFNKSHSLTAFLSYMPLTDTWLPVIGDDDQILDDQANTGIGFYYQGKIRKLGLHAYFFRKDTKANDAFPLESGINTLGAQIKYPILESLFLTAEGAFQNGTRGESDRNAFGGHFHLDYSLPENIPYLRTLTLGGIYLSGDDPETEKHEGWDPLWSRWPKWSESYIYTLIRENGVAYWTNLSAVFLGVKAVINPDINACANLYFLGAPQEGPGSPSFAPLKGSGDNRGRLLVSRMNYMISKHLSGHFVWEHFWPGSFYIDGADQFNWFRFELLLMY